jgi:hypothetical protein
MNFTVNQKPDLMKRTSAYIVITGMLLMSSCLVSSLHPFYKAEDKIFDPAMLGSWIDSDSCIWTIEKNMVSDGFMEPEYPDSTYRITYYEEDDIIGRFIGTLFELKGVKYVDFYPDPNEDHCVSDFTCMHHFPTHTLARIQLDQDILMFYWYGDEWLNELFEQNRIRIKHETVEISKDYERHLLTAPTEDLQKFIIKYANNPKTGIDVDQIFAFGEVDDDMEDSGAFLKLKPYDGPLPEEKAKQLEPNIVN